MASVTAAAWRSDYVASWRLFGRDTQHQDITAWRTLRQDLTEQTSDARLGTLSIEDPSQVALANVLGALNQTGSGQRQTRLVFYGGSHTAVDEWTGAVRELMQRRFGDGGHGYTHLAPTFDGYMQWGVRVNARGWTALRPAADRPQVDRYGLAGIMFVGGPGATSTISTDHTLASRVQLYFSALQPNTTVSLELDGRRVPLPTAAHYTGGVIAEFAVPDQPHSLNLRVTSGSATFYGASFERDHGVIIDNLALTGSKARHLLLWDAPLWRHFIASRRPDMIVLAYGNNELEDRHLTFEQHAMQFASMLSRVRNAVPRASCLVLGSGLRTLTRSDPLAYIQSFVDIQRTWAFRNGCAFMDIREFQGGAQGFEQWRNSPALLRSDGVHWSNPTYRAFGRAFIRALLDYRDRFGDEPAPVPVRRGTRSRNQSATG